MLSMLFVVAPCYAQNEQKVPSNDIEIIEVTSSGFTSLNHQIIDREEFIDSAQSLSDVVKHISGIQVLTAGGIGNPVAISIRGSNTKQVQLYIDGQLINDGQFGSFDLNQIPAEHIESIEITKNQAAGTGSSPIGGVISIKTYDSTTNTSKVSAGVGSFGYQELNALYNRINNQHHFSVGAHLLHSDNDYEYLVPSPSANAQTPTKEATKNNHFTKKSFFINNTNEWNRHQLRLNIQYSDQEKGILSYQRNPEVNRSKTSAHTIRSTMQYQWASAWDKVDQVNISYNFERKKEQYLSAPQGDSELLVDHISYKNNVNFQPVFLLPINHGTLKLSPYATFSQQDYRSDSLLHGSETTCSINICDVKATQQQTHLGTRAEFSSTGSPYSAYVLINHLQEKNSNISIKDPDATQLNANKTYSTQEIGMQYFSTAFKSQFNITHAARAPTLNELFGDRGLLKGADDLEAERAKSYGLTMQFDLGQLKVNSSIYHQEINNSIVVLYSDGGIGKYQNIAKAQLNGLELQFDWLASKKSSFSFQSNIIDSQTNSSIKSFNNKNLPSIYHQQYSLGYQYTFDKNWNIKLSSAADLDLYFDRSNVVEGNANPADRHSTDINLNWQHKKYNINFSINNLFNNSYKDLTNRDASGLTTFLKFSIRGI